MKNPESAVTEKCLWCSVQVPLQVRGNKWHHVAWVYDGASLKLYVDKQLDKTTPITGTHDTFNPTYRSSCLNNYHIEMCLIS